MNILQKTIARIDTWQRRHPFTAFPYAVIKKYGEDQAGYQAALLTYYGFLSLFPLLLVVTTLITIFAGQNDALRDTVMQGITSYFPTFGTQLSDNVSGINKSGAPLIIGILFTLYGARGVADAFRSGVNHIWQTPVTKRDKFPLGLGKSIAIILVGGGGFLLASITNTIATGSDRGIVFRLAAIAITVFILFWLFRFLLNISLAKHIPARSTRSGALAAAIGIMFLQLAGGFILQHELRTLSAVSSYFAVVLGLLFWIYLQAQIIYYSIEVASVRSLRLYPRGMRDDDLTPADERAYARQAEREQQIPAEAIKTKFNKR